MTRIVLVDDDDLFRESLAGNLLDAGFAVADFPDGKTALEYFASEGVADIVLLDWKMPGMTGIEVLREMRQAEVLVPVIFLTGMNDQIYEESALNSGAVDFVDKSRSFTIVLKRVQLTLDSKSAALIGSGAGTTSRRFGDLELRPDSNRALWKGKEAALTLTEFAIVQHLATNTGRDIGYREIYDLVHGKGFAAGEGEEGYRTNVRTFVKRIRQKFRDLDVEFDQIKNYPGFGYRWVADNQDNQQPS